MSDGARQSNTPVGMSGRDVAAEYAQRLRAECERAWAAGEPLPRLPSGAINKTLVAQRCGFPRRVFATNPTALELLNAYDARDTERNAGASYFDKAQRARARTNRSDAYTRKLERRVLELEAEVAGLRRECARFTAIEQIMTRSGKLP
jgi:hypothetical protein